MQKPAKRFEEKRDDFAGILDPAGSARSYGLNRYRPSPALAPFVEHYWVVSWELPEGASYLAEVLPHPNLNLAFTRERGWITGVTTGRYDYEVKGAGAVFGVMFRPGGFRPFFGRAVAELTDATLDAATIFPRATETARATLMGEPDRQQMIALAEAILTDGGLPATDPNTELAAGIVELARTDREIVSVAALARRAGVNERTLQHLFQHYVGSSPKWVIRLYRLVEAAARATAEDAPNWTEVAHELGYADQAHFSNDFRRIVGRAPTEYQRDVRQSATRAP
ncbi:MULTISPECIES: AraC family transcriptional regulator [unclassified Devosia]|uniref:helix-turn-helix domain-containing protein n=1 Tax=unclassified Devosia TaxID=196773 RepID=UPI001ACD5D4E|nr:MULTISPECIES: AraC family transcriptional regulator [unclassified Devosia]MBN9360582.1 AraC family transcriptional regulator [Devosia sp.]